MASKSKVIIALFILYVSTGWAGVYRTELFSINLEEGWSCNPSDNAFICTEDLPKTKKSAVIVVNFGPRSQSDSLAYFSRVYGTPRILNPNGKVQIRSKVESLEMVQINNKDYVKALHFEGELADYYTYYLATLTDTHIFLFNFSANKEDLENYRAMFERTMSSITVSTVPVELEAARPMAANSSPVENQNAQPPAVVSAVESQGQNPEGTSGFKTSHIFLMFSVIALGLVGLYAIRS